MSKFSYNVDTGVFWDEESGMALSECLKRTLSVDNNFRSLLSTI